MLEQLVGLDVDGHSILAKHLPNVKKVMLEFLRALRQKEHHFGVRDALQWLLNELSEHRHQGKAVLK